MTVRENAKVSYIGDGVGGLALGDQGRVIADAGSAAHVLWTSGSLRGQMSLVGYEDLVEPTGRQASVVATVDDSLGDGPLVVTAVREVYDTFGPDGLLSALADEGHLASLASAAEEVFETVAGRVRSDPAFREVLARLDGEEQDAFVTHTTTALLRDALGREDS